MINDIKIKNRFLKQNPHSAGPQLTECYSGERSFERIGLVFVTNDLHSTVRRVSWNKWRQRDRSLPHSITM